MNDTQVARFWAKVSPEPNTGCWLWMAGVDPKGYGRLSITRARPAVLAHRVAWELEYGTAPAACVLHRCDQPGCVNPSHLFLGTVYDNVADMVAKSRQARGARHGQVTRKHSLKLDADKVREIRRLAASGVPTREIEARFGLCSRYVPRIVRGGAWASVT